MANAYAILVNLNILNFFLGVSLVMGFLKSGTTKATSTRTVIKGTSTRPSVEAVENEEDSDE